MRMRIWVAGLCTRADAQLSQILRSAPSPTKHEALLNLRSPEPRTFRSSTGGGAGRSRKIKGLTPEDWAEGHFLP